LERTGCCARRGLDRTCSAPSSHSAQPTRPRCWLLDRFVALEATGDSDAAFAGRFDVAALRWLWRRTDLVKTARGLPNVLLVHARDDEEVPFAVSERLAAVLAPPMRLMALESGGHKGPPRSPEAARATIEWAFACAAR
jgi:hypothetical protein